MGIVSSLFVKRDFKKEIRDDLRGDPLDKLKQLRDKNFFDDKYENLTPTEKIFVKREIEKEIARQEREQKRIERDTSDYVKL